MTASEAGRTRILYHRRANAIGEIQDARMMEVRCNRRYKWRRMILFAVDSEQIISV
jgi:hypothetical protein